MQTGGIATTYPFRTTTATAGTSSAGVAADTQSLRDRALDMLKSTAETDADDMKARARQKLDDAKKQLEYLRRWNFDPEILARQAGHLAREVGAAAKDFAAAVSSAGSTTGAAAFGSIEAQVTLSGPSDAQTAGTTDNAEDDMSFAQKAYQDTMKDGTEQQTVSADDRKTLEEIKAVAHEIKALLEEAVRRMREQKNADQNAISEAQKSGESLNQAIEGLNAALGSGSPAGAPSMMIAIPASITI
ncbi:hypothetical protein [Pararhizobium sp. PWRC1-1]|uniref:hypothetical protein n=1 Tax=Pararhizobium sp. PWRC1-1 TaxID=2804566 RepID=UPI003CEC95DD